MKKEFKTELKFMLMQLSVEGLAIGHRQVKTTGIQLGT